MIKSCQIVISLIKNVVIMKQIFDFSIRSARDSFMWISIAFFATVLILGCDTNRDQVESDTKTATMNCKDDNLGTYTCEDVTVPARVYKCDSNGANCSFSWGTRTVYHCSWINVDFIAPSWPTTPPIDTTLYYCHGNTAINNLQEYLKCFKPSRFATITIYVREAVVNSTQIYTLTQDSQIDIGECWIKISQGSVSRVFGFYPQTESYNPKRLATAPGGFYDKGNCLYNIGVTKSVTAAQFTQIMNFINVIYTDLSTYDFALNNNAEFVYDIAYYGGFVYYSPLVSWPDNLGSTITPALLGESIRYTDPQTSILDDAGGYSDSSLGTCL